MQINELKAEIVRNGMTLGEVADKIGMQRTTLWRRFKNPDEFTMAEVKRIKTVLNLDGDKVLTIFFDHGVS